MTANPTREVEADRQIHAEPLGFRGIAPIEDGGYPVTSGFADRLRQLRRQRNLSQAELASQAGMHVNHLGRYERGESQPSADALKRLADALGTSTDFLIEGATDAAAKGRFEDRELLRRFQEVEQLAPEDKQLVAQFLDALLFKRKVEGLSAR
jgi:transcriptional regulator with XRE-family HTH domain